MLPKVAKKEKVKSKTVRFRCTTYEQKLLKVKARKAGLSVSEYCRRAAFDDRIIERLTEDQIAMYKMFVDYQNNFIRIGNMFKKRNPKLSEEVNQLAKEIKDHLFNFKK
ncbi:mobilization protein MbpA [Flagellimonas sp. 2504JD1-5]